MAEFLFFKWGKEVFEPHKDKIGNLIVEEVGNGEFKVSSNGKTYTVNVKRTFEKEYAASCECEYFKHKKRVCKHIAKVMYEARYKSAFEIPEMEELQEEDIDEMLEETEKVAEELGFERADEKAKKTAERVQKIIDKDEQAVILMDKMDEEMMLKLDIGWMAEEEYPLLYEFEREVKLKDGSKKIELVRQLTWAGWIMAARLQGNIKVEPAKFERLKDGTVIASAFATDLEKNVTMPGQSTKIYGKRYVYEVLSSKAIRNALKRVIDPTIVEQVVEYAKKRNAIKRLEFREVAVP